MLRWLRIILGEIICESSNWQQIQRLKITISGANWQLFRMERIAKCSYFILSTQNIKFYWFVMKIKKFLLPIWCYNRGLFPLWNKYFGVFVLNGLNSVCKPFISLLPLIYAKSRPNLLFKWRQISTWTKAKFALLFFIFSILFFSFMFCFILVFLLFCFVLFL